MNEFDPIQPLAAKARKEQAPPVNVTADVLHDLQSASFRDLQATPFFLFAGLSLAAAAVVLVVSLETWAVFDDPLSGFFTPISMVMR